MNPASAQECVDVRFRRKAAPGIGQDAQVEDLLAAPSR
jgi:hypothetical protein